MSDGNCPIKHSEPSPVSHPGECQCRKCTAFIFSEISQKKNYTVIHISKIPRMFNKRSCNCLPPSLKQHVPSESYTRLTLFKKQNKRNKPNWNFLWRHRRHSHMRHLYASCLAFKGSGSCRRTHPPPLTSCLIILIIFLCTNLNMACCFSQHHTYFESEVILEGMLLKGRYFFKFSLPSAIFPAVDRSNPPRSLQKIVRGHQGLQHMWVVSKSLLAWQPRPQALRSWLPG